jgi:thiamine-monophosphate kinase
VPIQVVRNTMKEFAIIKEFLTLPSSKRKDVLKGIGDDCALVKVPRGQRLALSMDTLIGDVHFIKDSNPADIAHKAIAVNLSDLAAAGAEPAWLTLSLTIPEFDREWLSQFHQGLKRMVEYFGVEIIGGDTCRGPLSITIQAHGFVPENVFLSRNNAQAGDLICVTGELGDAALGLLVAQNKLQVSQEDQLALLKKYQTPYPRIAAGIALRGQATSAIDISDGLMADINHISRQSDVGALLHWERMPLSKAMKNIDDNQLQMRAALTGGDDYELCFSVNEDDLEATRHALETVGANCYPIGRLTGKQGVRLMHHKQEIELSGFSSNGSNESSDILGYQHF